MNGTTQRYQPFPAHRILPEEMDLAYMFVIALDTDGRIWDLNRRASQILGYPREELLGQDWFSLYLPARFRSATRRVFECLLAGEVQDVEHFEQPVFDRAGDEIVVTWHNSVLRDAKGNITGTLACGEVVTQLRRSQRALRVLSDCNRVILNADDHDRLLKDIIRRLASENAYPFAWFGRRAHDATGILPVLHAGQAGDFFEAVGMNHGPTLEALVQNRPVVVPRLSEAVDRYGIWAQTGLNLGFGAALALPVRTSMHDLGVITVFALEPGALQMQEGVILEELAVNLELGLQHQYMSAQVEAIARFPQENPNPVLRVSGEGILLYANPASEKLLHSRRIDVGDRVPERWCAATKSAITECAVQHMEMNIVDRHFLSTIAPVADADYVNFYLQDITAKKQAMLDLDRSLTRLRTYTQATPAFILELDLNGRILFANRVYEELRIADVIGTELSSWLPEDETEGVYTIFQQVITSGENRELQYTATNLRGQRRHYIADLRPLHNSSGEIESMLLTATDITELEQIRGTLSEGQELIANLVETIPFSIFWKNRDLVYLGGNNQVAREAGLASAAELPGKTDFDLAWRREQAEAFRRDDLEVISSAKPKLNIVETQLRADGTEVTLLTNKVPLRGNDGEVIGVLGVYADITEREQAKKTLSRANRALLVLSACEEVLIRTTSEQQLATSICGLIVEIGGHALAWVTYSESGLPTGEVASAHLDQYSDLPTLAGSSISCLINNNAPYLLLDKDSDDCADGMLTAYLRDHDVDSVLILPLQTDQNRIGYLGIISAQCNAFDPQELTFLQKLANNMAYGINNLRTQVARDNAETSLRAALDQTISAFAIAVEKRDLYTAGHQQRVAELCNAIAKRMKLDQNRIRGLYQSALIHDIGKISIPAEILNRPGRLTSEEFELVKTHSEIGYEIVKGVEFPWPVATIIRQHHERIDGSGYPDGLRGGEILLEARILAVADVMEACTSHRPYRPAGSIDAALAHISEASGRLYDPAVVDACRLIVQSGEFPPSC